MRLADIIRQCREAGVQSVKLHPDGSIAEMFFAPVTPVPPAPKKPTPEEEQALRNPRRNALDLAAEIAADLRPQKAH